MTRGFTLIEVLIVLALLSLTAAVAGLAMKPQDLRLSAGDEFARYVRAARTRALEHGVPARVQVSADGIVTTIFPTTAPIPLVQQRLLACNGAAEVERAAAFTITQVGVIQGDTATFRCAGAVSRVLVRRLAGEIVVEE